MTDSPLHLTLRELRSDLTQPKGLIALAGVGVLLGISGPFETTEYLTLVPRIAYWTVIAYVTYAVGAFINIYLNARLPNQLGPLPLKIVINGVATGIGVMAVLSLINFVVFGWPYQSTGEFFASFLVIVTVSTIIAGLLMVLGPDIADELTNAPTAPALLDRLPFDKRGPLVALTVEDHYVHVTTTKGQEMLLMRLSDAIKETQPTRGLQVHRSHWVALDQIAAAKRVGDRAVLTLHNGTEVPASRSYIPALKDAGLFPVTAHG